MQHDTLCRKPATESDVDWDGMADRVLAGGRLTTEEALGLLNADATQMERVQGNE